ncbi:hypothetical protein BGX27_009093 [Mortierella sp. AM989]|nr:hypothetical protein BGX27_009093 [Mortierella sp. AM989]
MSSLKNGIDAMEETGSSLSHQSISFTAPVTQQNEEVVYEDPSEKNFKDKRYHESYPQLLVFPRIFTKSAWKLLIATSVIVVCFIWLYVGSVWSPNARVHNIKIYIYNDDDGFNYSQTTVEVAQQIQAITNNTSLGTILQNSIMNPESSINHAFRWNVLEPVPGWTRDSVVDKVEKGHMWGVIYIPSNFSQNLLTFAPTIATGPATNAELKLVSAEYIYDQGRHYAAHSLIEKNIRGSLNPLFKNIEKQILNSQYTQSLLQEMNPNLWINLMGWTETVLHPVITYGQNLASYLVFVVLFIGSTLTVYTTCKFLPTTIESIGVLDFMSEKYPALQIVLARSMLAMVFSIVHTTLIWMVPQVLNGHQMDSHYSPGKCFAFTWMMGLAFIFMLFMMARILTVDGFQAPATVFLILMFTSSGGIMDQALQPGFFRIGQAFPFFYGVRGMRTIWFGSLRNKMWINWVVISAWILIPGIIIIIVARSDLQLRREILRREARGEPIPEKKKFFSRLKK